MEIEKLSADQFPAGQGSRYRSSEEFYELLEQIAVLRPTDCLRVSLPERSKSSAFGLSRAIRVELKRKHKQNQFVITCRADEKGVYRLWARRVA